MGMKKNCCTYPAISTLLNNINTWEMDHFLCSDNDRTLILVFSQLLPYLWVLQSFLSFWGNNSPQNTCLAVCSLPNNKNTWEMDHVCVLPKTDAVYCLMAAFGQESWSLQAFLLFWRKMAPNTHILPFPMSKTPGIWTISMHFQCLNHVHYFLTVWGQLLCFLGTSVIWTMNAPHIHIYPSRQQKQLEDR
jgi:hypothetical protein